MFVSFVLLCNVISIIAIQHMMVCVTYHIYESVMVCNLMGLYIRCIIMCALEVYMIVSMSENHSTELIVQVI